MTYESILRAAVYVSAALLVVCGIVLTATAQAACPTQQPAVIAADGKLSVCTDEQLDAVEVERSGGATQMVAGPFTVGEPSGPYTLVGCAEETLRARAINAAGAGAWGSPVAATFPPCGVPVLVAPVP